MLMRRRRKKMMMVMIMMLMMMRRRRRRMKMVMLKIVETDASIIISLRVWQYWTYSLPPTATTG